MKISCLSNINPEIYRVLLPRLGNQRFYLFLFVILFCNRIDCIDYFCLKFNQFSIKACDCFAENKVEGIWVDVCKHGGRCWPCGVATLTSPGKWADVYCLGGGIVGNEVRLRHGYDVLHYCSLDIFGDVKSQKELCYNTGKNIDTSFGFYHL